VTCTAHALNFNVIWFAFFIHKTKPCHLWRLCSIEWRGAGSDSGL